MVMSLSAGRSLFSRMTEWYHRVLHNIKMPTPLHQTSLTKSLKGVYRAGKHIYLLAIGLGMCCLRAMFGLQLCQRRVVHRLLMPKRRLGIV
jgi:anthranilate/para-aminobenzoate synthase component II